MTFIILVFNFFISWLNAYSCGKSWNYTKLQGGFSHLLNWCIAIMSASGFTWCFLFILAMMANIIGLLNEVHVDLSIKIGYLLIAPAVISSGLVMTINSWVNFWQRPSLTNAVVTAWNTHAQATNMSNAVHLFPQFVGDIFKVALPSNDPEGGQSDDDKGGLILLLVIPLVITAIIIGVLLTRYIILTTAENNPVSIDS